ncbi:MAG: Cof-type HAD-IIB family hydrolase [Schleiferilactobacillus harbinensis]|jgi:Cof subfamily protein (haloacid dehalogenase superfamily)|nr:Cof-type HAD-IIB family hydrolase [Schleiferilactobacillus harbinensis]MCI1912089.1 Cof-type HAD-IIB family hydrolase [Schleiferilactobacillus harbinensis]
MTRKLIALDLDGTTLNSASQISAQTRQVLQAASAAGHIVTIATGRPYGVSVQYYDTLGLTTPMINFNGALVHIPHQRWAGEYERRLPMQAVDEILAMRDRYHIQLVAAEGKNMMFVDTDKPELMDTLPMSVAENPVLTPATLPAVPTSLMVVIPTQAGVNMAQEIMNDFPSVNVNTWGGPENSDLSVLEIIHAGIEKTTGIDYLARYYHIANDDIIAFGDEFNDLHMLNHVGWGVAMANGSAAVKAVANDITPLTNDQNGVADYLTSYLHLAAQMNA